ncbi:hypothetical protein [Cellulomonas sp. HZM]|uniref:hypothetical protein n=1 Tax=Cellulomonas sp. HZM TaxID=1454010 RepID=UPI000493249D|nr:hypothetical protein [Cellulomonas sp. HZM]
MGEEDWIDIDNQDIRAAREAWFAAKRQDPTSARTAQLEDDFRRLLRAHVQQVEERSHEAPGSDDP